MILNRERSTLLDTISSLQGQIQTLKDWNESLKCECKELREIIYRRFGLVREVTSDSASLDKPIQTFESWRTAKGKLERAHSAGKLGAEQPQILAEQQAYWEAKLKNQEGLSGAKPDKNDTTGT